MNLFDNDILNLQDVNTLIMKPRDISRDEFRFLCVFDNVDHNNIIECRHTGAAALECGLIKSLGDVRRSIKGQAFGIGKRKITKFEDELSEDEFFNTGMEGLKWTSIKDGKKRNEVILIWDDEALEDRWFGITYDEWKENRENEKKAIELREKIKEDGK